MTETELKLRFASAQESSLLAHPRLASATDCGSEHLVATYFDTPDLRLRGAGVALRVRREDGKWVQTVKTEGAVANGIHSRQEIDEPILGPGVDLTKLPVEGPIGQFFAPEQVRNRLHPVVETDIHRHRFTLETLNGARIDAAVDIGVVRAGGGASPISELELELLDGDPGVLLSIAVELSDAAVLEIEQRNKAEQGYELLYPSRPKPVFADLPVLTREMSAEDALQAILGCCVNHLHGNLAAVLDGQAEGVHQMRVGLRRFRSCLNVYKRLVPADVTATVRAEARWLGEALGPVRDWDVFSDNLSTVRQQFPERRSLRTLLKRCAAVRAARNAELTDRLGSPRYHILILTLAEWIHNRGWSREMDAESRDRLRRPVVDYAGKVLRRLHRRLMEDGENFSQLSPAAKHALRIQVKRLRYGLQFFSSLYGGKSTKRMLRALGDLQDDLGVLHDVHVAHALLNEINLKSSNPARALLDGWFGARADYQDRHAWVAWRQYVDAPIPWR